MSDPNPYPQPKSDLDIGDVIKTSINLFAENAVLFLILAGVLIGIPYFIYSLAMVGMIESIATGTSVVNSGFWIWNTVGSIVSTVCALLLQATVTIAVVNILNGRRVDFQFALNQALRHIVPLFLLSLMLGIAIAIGFALLIIPGVILTLMWIVAVPAYISEDIEIMDAFGRSASLTKGQRLRILGLIVVVAIISIVIQLVFSVFTGPLTDPFARFTFTGAVFGTALQTISGILSSIGGAVLYLRLRQLKDGTDVGSISSVFE